jgi:hypothetical protein
MLWYVFPLWFVERGTDDSSTTLVSCTDSESNHDAHCIEMELTAGMTMLSTLKRGSGI